MNQNSRTLFLVYTAMMTAVLSVLSLIRIPTPTGVPFTLQTFAAALSGFLLGWKYGAVSILLYLFHGAMGIPVFSGMTAGPGVLFGVTGGFLWGFLPLSLLCGLGLKKGYTRFTPLFGISGLLCCHIAGVLQFSFVTDRSPLESAVLVSLPYLLKDILSVLGAIPVSLTLKKALSSASLLPEDSRAGSD